MCQQMSSGSFKDINYKFANGLGFNPRSSHTKDSKMALDATLLNTQCYKVGIKGIVDQSREWSCAPPYSSVSQPSKREPSGHPRLRTKATLKNYMYK